MRQLAMTLIVALLALCAWLLLPRAAAAPSVDHADVHEAGPTPAAVAGSKLERQAEDAPALPPEPEASAIEPYAVTFVVFDDASTPVEGASVELWAAERGQLLRPDAGNNTSSWLGRAAGPPLLTLTTDAEGTCRVVMRREMACVSARHADFGASVVHAIGRAWLNTDREVSLWLARPILVRGIVLAADGTPVPDAVITVLAEDSSSARPKARFVQTGPIAADTTGHFRFEAILGARCRLQAEADGKVSASLRLEVLPDCEAVLTFRGGVAIVGRLLDDSGNGVPLASVAAWRTTRSPRQLPGEAEVGRTMTDQAGEFELLAPIGNFWVRGAVLDASGRRSPFVAVTTSLHDRRPRIELRLAPPAPIRGVVHHADGSPAVVMLLLDCEGTGANDPLRFEHIFPEPTDADGSFVRNVPAGASWTLHFIGKDAAGHWVSAVREHVASGTNGLEIVLDDGADQTRKVSGEVVHDADGSPVTHFSLWLAHKTTEGLIAGEVTSGVDGGNHFVIYRQGSTDLGLIAETTQAELASGYAELPPAAANQHVVIRVRPCGEVPVRVVTNTGSPARGLWVNTVGRAPAGASFTNAGLTRTDGEGRALVRAPAGRRGFTVVRLFETLAERELEVLPGPNPEVTITVRL